MEKRRGNKIFSTITGGIIVFCISILLSGHGTSDAYAKDSADSTGTEQIKTALLRPGGWIAEWKANSSGESDFLFEDRGGKVVVKINTTAWNQSCERDVTITPDAVKMDGCNDTGITLLYDPNDKAYPFKGESKHAYYNLRRK